MATDIIEVAEDGCDIRVVSVAYDEVKPKFQEIVYITKTINTGTGTNALVLVQSDEPTDPEVGIMWLHIETRRLQIYTLLGWEEVVMKYEIASDLGTIDINAGYF